MWWLWSGNKLSHETNESQPMKADESKPSRPDKFENISDINDTFDITK